MPEIVNFVAPSSPVVGHDAPGPAVNEERSVERAIVPGKRGNSSLLPRAADLMVLLPTCVLGTDSVHVRYCFHGNP